ncbi:hypothetical protein CYMTET_34029 [Cymbomonas tetramitiformis]|uniref:Uncharacterized protein n=1 Tax=Cymbomonas tetramitiformis TaxID=36881 RepID=A0AAE0KQD2_9CHLO|nr:hypothetical protein CYMTET_34029 [Cymbomonas tetramitiformis]
MDGFKFGPLMFIWALMAVMVGAAELLWFHCFLASAALHSSVVIDQKAFLEKMLFACTYKSNAPMENQELSLNSGWEESIALEDIDRDELRKFVSESFPRISLPLLRYFDLSFMGLRPSAAGVRAASGKGLALGEEV